MDDHDPTGDARVRRPLRTRRGPARLLVAAAVPLLVALLTVGCGFGSDEPDPPGTQTITAGGVALHAVVREPAGEPSGLTVLFLHGSSYTSRIWHDRGILDRVAEHGHRAVAVDLPGHGKSEASDEAPADVLASLVEELGPAADVVVVSPSMSGRFSLAMLAERPGVELGGFVAVAPVGIPEFRRPHDAPSIPTLLLWGEDDDVVDPALADALGEQMADSRVAIVQDGSHAPYDDEPDAFLASLEPFLADVAG